VEWGTGNEQNRSSLASSLVDVIGFGVGHLVVVILLEYDGYPGDDGAQAISEVSEDTTTTIVIVSSGYGIGALRGPGDGCEDGVC
jgi:hypothetical protein